MFLTPYPAGGQRQNDDNRMIVINQLDLFCGFMIVCSEAQNNYWPNELI
jgi:hypothetical protein